MQTVTRTLFSTIKTEGAILPLAPVGGFLAWNANTLAMRRPGSSQTLQITNVSGRVAEIGGKVPPPPETEGGE